MDQFRLVSSVFQGLDRSIFDKLVDKWEMDKGVRKFTTWDETRTLLIAGLMGIKSLREIEEVLFVPHSTLDDALRNRRSGFFYELCKATINEIIAIAPHRKVRRALKVLLAMDSTSIRVNGRLASEEVWGAKFAKNKKRAAAKLTVLWDVGGEWVQDFRISGGFGYDSPIADQFAIVKGATYVFDRGYTDIGYWWKLIAAGANFVTRLKDWKRNKAERQELIAGAENQFGVLWTGPWQPSKKSSNRHLEVPENTFRRVIFRDEESGKLLDFVTSDWSTPGEVIADIYKKRWAIELVFRWFKGHLSIRYLDTRNKNSIKTQLAVAILTRLLIQLAKIKQGLKQTAWHLLRTIQAYIRRNGLVTLAFTTAYSPKPRRKARSGGIVWEI